MRPTMRFGKKLTILSTTAIKHQLGELMQVSDREDLLAREKNEKPSPAVPASA